MSKKIVKEYFSEARIALVKEIRNHPPLMYMLQQIGPAAWEQQLAEIAAYCFIIVEGTYSPKELDGLYDILIASLRSSNKLIVTSGNDSIH